MEDRVDLTIGRRLRARRRLLGLTQQEVAARCGVSFQQVHKYETATSRMSAAMLWNLVCALDLEIGEVFAGLSTHAVAADPTTGPGSIGLGWSGYRHAAADASPA